MTASCACGQVGLEATGAPILSAVCYCDDCHAGSRWIEGLQNAASVREPDGGTAYTLFRLDRVTCVRGAALLHGHKLNERSATNRVVATCCNSAMYMSFDRGPFWVSAYRARFQGQLPPLQMRICTKFRAAELGLTRDVPSHPGYPLAFISKIVAARIAMLFGR